MQGGHGLAFLANQSSFHRHGVGGDALHLDSKHILEICLLDRPFHQLLGPGHLVSFDPFALRAGSWRPLSHRHLDRQGSSLRDALTGNAKYLSNNYSVFSAIIVG